MAEKSCESRGKADTARKSSLLKKKKGHGVAQPEEIEDEKSE